MAWSRTMTEFTGSNYFLNIPAKVARDSRIKSDKAIILFGEINSMLNVSDKCFISNSTFAKRLNCTERTIQNCIKNLKECGYINAKNIINPETGAIIKREITFTDYYLTGQLFKDLDDKKEEPGETDDMGEVKHISRGRRNTFRKPGETDFAIIEQYNKTNIKERGSAAETANPSQTKNKNSNDHIAIYKQVTDYLNLKTGASYKPTSPETRKLIDELLAKGYTVKDMLKVIDLKAFEWQGSKMFSNMRPKTLFSLKYFEDYLNGVPIYRVTNPVTKRKEPTVNELQETRKQQLEAQERNMKLMINPDTDKPFKSNAEKQLYVNNLFNDLEVGGN